MTTNKSRKKDYFANRRALRGFLPDCFSSSFSFFFPFSFFLSFFFFFHLVMLVVSMSGAEFVHVLQFGSLEDNPALCVTFKPGRPPWDVAMM